MKRFLRLFGTKANPQNRKKAAPRARLNIEALEDRWVPNAVRGVTGFALSDLGPTDDGSSNAVAIGFQDAQGHAEQINFFGQRYDHLFVNNNGNVTFDSPLGTYTPFTIKNATAKIIAPFFADVDTRGAGRTVTYGTGVVDGHQSFVANWIRVDYFNATDSSHTIKLNSFQLVLVNRDDTGAGNFDIEFNYDAINWETGSASGGQDGVGGNAGNSAHAGFSNGVDASYELPGSGTPGAFLGSGLTGSSLNSDVAGRYVFASRNGTIQHFDVDTGVNEVNAGTEFLITVIAKDISNRDVTDYTGTIHFTSSDPQAVLPADYTFSAGNHGSQVFHVTLRTAGRQTITVTDTRGIAGIGQIQVNAVASNPTTAPPAPTGLSWAPSSASNGTLSWSDVTGADGYYIWYWDGTQWVFLAQTAAHQTSLYITNGSGYYFSVGAFNSVGVNYSPAFYVS